jgi:hypothetical protein
MDQVAGCGVWTLHEALLHTLDDGIPFPGKKESSVKYWHNNYENQSK